MKQLATFLRGGLVVGALAIGAEAARAQAPVWQSAIGVATGGTVSSQVNNTTTDAAGNIYVVGYFYGSVSFGNVPLTSNGDYDAFVAKWSAASRTFVWAQKLGGSGVDFATSVAVSGTSVYVAGNFSGTATVGTAQLSSAGDYDTFVTKFADNGTGATLDWAQRAGGPGRDRANALAVSGTGVFVAGDFEGTTATFGGTTLASGNTSTQFITNAYVAKLADAGPSAGYVWAQGVASPAANTGNALAVVGPAVYLAGSFQNTAVFGGITKTSAGSTDAYLARLTDAGSSATFGWVQGLGGTGSETAWGLAAAGPAVYLCGVFTGTAAFGPTALTSTGGNDAYVVKCLDGGASGSVAWAQQVGGTGSQLAYGIKILGVNVYISGVFNGSTTVGATTLVSAGQNDVLVAKLTDAGPSGSVAWVQQAGGTGNDSSLSLAVTPMGTVFVGGGVLPPATFGPLLLGTAGTTGIAQIGFLAALANPTGTATAQAAELAGFTLAPNPAHNTATVQLPAVPGAATATLTVLDALGRAVRTQAAVLNASAVLDLAGLVPGLYAVRVAAGGRTATRRLVVE